MSALARVPPHVLGGRWLAGVSSTPSTITDQWRHGQLAPVQVSCRFDVVRVHGESLTTALVAELYASGLPLGPVLYDHGARQSYWLVPVRPGTAWQMRDTCLLTVPEDGGPPPAVLMPAPGVGRVGSLQWLVTPDGTGTLTGYDVLAVALRRARGSLALARRRHSRAQ
ncbi:hypothetical protein ACFYUY_04505 [Kitasatospora sp. NPDC004745]|uniref:hypothetical protein n=1 Tax=Kitasatospora sp. NPDC004745 TaxID=3364019 RepID=UPI0036C32AC2